MDETSIIKNEVAMEELNFINGVAIAYTRDKYGNRLYGLEDKNGNKLCAKEFSYIYPQKFSHYLVEKGSKKNLLRLDGSLVLEEWFQDIYDLNEDGLFVIGNTIRKTKTTPTQYLRGIAHTSGIILFPVIYHSVRRITEPQTDEEREAGKEPVYKNDFYAEFEEAPYILSMHGGLYDPKGSHLPTKLSFDYKDFFEKVLNWVLPGLQFFYRDTDAPVIVRDTYHVGDVFRAGFFIDTTTKLLKPAHKTRFLIASAHAAMLGEAQEDGTDAKRWGLSVFHYNSYFKVMDVYTLNGVTQVLLLHIPTAAAYFMGDGEALLNFIDQATGDGTSLVQMARLSLEEKMEQNIHPRSQDKLFVERMFHPIGLDDEYWPVNFNPLPEPDDEQTANLSSIIHKLAQDDDIDGFLREEDNFKFCGVEGYICERCIYQRGIVGNGEGCGRLFKASFRDRYLRGHCEYLKEIIENPSVFEYRKKKEIETLQKQSDEFALKLVKEFITEELNGDIYKLKSYDFRNIKNKEKYGGSEMLERSDIMRSIMVLAFGDVWPELNMDNVEHYKYLCGTINSPNYLMGANILDQYLKGMQNWGASESQIHRAIKVWHLCEQIGNWWILPGNAACFSTQLNGKFKGYGDRYLLQLYENMTSSQKTKIGRKVMLMSEAELLKGHAGPVGFANIVRENMLEGMVDSSERPIEIFDYVWSYKKDLTKDQYFNAIDKFCSFCEDFIPKRSERIVEKLKLILNQ